MTISKEKIAFIVAGIHRLGCSPREQLANGRYRLLTAELPAYGGPECLCHTKSITYNGEKVK